jgi:hypothetical protein
MVHLVVVVLDQVVVLVLVLVVQQLLTPIQIDKVILEVVDTIIPMSTSMVAAVVEHPHQEVMLLLMELLTLQQVLE